MPREATWEASGEGQDDRLTRVDANTIATDKRSIMKSQKQSSARSVERVVQKSTSQSRIQSAMMVQHKRFLGTDLDRGVDDFRHYLKSSRAKRRDGKRRATVNALEGLGFTSPHLPGVKSMGDNGHLGSENESSSWLSFVFGLSGRKSNSSLGATRGHAQSHRRIGSLDLSDGKSIVRAFKTHGLNLEAVTPQMFYRVVGEVFTK